MSSTEPAPFVASTVEHSAIAKPPTLTPVVGLLVEHAHAVKTEDVPQGYGNIRGELYEVEIKALMAAKDLAVMLSLSNHHMVMAALYRPEEP